MVHYINNNSSLKNNKMNKLIVLVLGCTGVLLASKGQVNPNAAKTPIVTGKNQIVQKITGLRGYVDMHTHLMSHLGFGGKVLYGAPDENTIMLKGSIYRGWDLFKPTTCNEGNEVPGSIGRALSDCNAIHGGWGATDNNCGNTIRAEIVNKVENL
jgi:hypothetical protein